MPDSKPTILVADDEERFRNALVDALRFFGYDVLVAKTGEELDSEATQLINSGQPYLLIVDNQMPEKAGERERQWCGFTRVLALCSTLDGQTVGQHVLFLSRWGIQDLPPELSNAGLEYGLLDKSRWHPVHIPFSTLKGHINNIFTGLAQ